MLDNTVCGGTGDTPRKAAGSTDTSRVLAVVLAAVLLAALVWSGSIFFKSEPVKKATPAAANLDPLRDMSPAWKEESSIRIC